MENGESIIRNLRAIETIQNVVIPGTEFSKLQKALKSSSELVTNSGGELGNQVGVNDKFNKDIDEKITKPAQRGIKQGLEYRFGYKIETITLWLRCRKERCLWLFSHYAPYLEKEIKTIEINDPFNLYK